jgi:hypothetical protein
VRGKKNKPIHKQCRQCGEWFTLDPRANRRQKFCTVSCAATWRGAQPKWKKAHSKRMKARVDPEAMREMSRAMWRNPEIRERLTNNARIRGNSPEHLAAMVEHNKKLWSDAEFRKQHEERSRQQFSNAWSNPEFREKASALTAELSAQRWADPDYRKKVSRSIRIAKAAPLEKKRQAKVNAERSQSPEARARSSQQMSERWADPEQRAQMTANASETAKRNWRDNPAYRKKHLATLRKNAPQSSVRMKETMKRLWADPAYVAEQKAKWTPERRAAQAEVNRKRWSDPKFKASVSANISKARRAQTEKK